MSTQHPYEDVRALLRSGISLGAGRWALGAPATQAPDAPFASPPAERNNESSPGGQRDRARTLGLTGASFGAFLLPIVARPFLSPVAASSVFAGSLLLEPVPAYFLDWKTGLAFSATQLGLLGMAALSSAALQLDALANFFFANFSSIGLYSTSIIYKLSSANQAPVVEMASPQPDNLMVFFSPFNWRNLLHPTVSTSFRCCMWRSVSWYFQYPTAPLYGPLEATNSEMQHFLPQPAFR